MTEFLSEPTGNVRWIPFKISIDWSYSRETDIDLVWSQACALYLSGYGCEVTVE